MAEARSGSAKDDFLAEQRAEDVVESTDGRRNCRDDGAFVSLFSLTGVGEDESEHWIIWLWLYSLL